MSARKRGAAARESDSDLSADAAAAPIIIPPAISIDLGSKCFSAGMTGGPRLEERGATALDAHDCHWLDWRAMVSEERTHAYKYKCARRGGGAGRGRRWATRSGCAHEAGARAARRAQRLTPAPPPPYPPRAPQHVDFSLLRARVV
jgi:hypothetical protein